MDILPERNRKPESNRDKCDTHNRQLPAEPDHDDNRRNHRDQAGEHAGKAFLHEPSALRGVTGNPVHQSTGSPVLNERKRQFLNLMIQLLSKVLADPGAHRHTGVITRDGDSDQRYGKHRHRNRVHNDFLRCSHSGTQVLIDEILLHLRNVKLHHRGRNHQKRNQGKQALVLAAEPEEFSESRGLSAALRAFAHAMDGTSADRTSTIAFPADCLLFGTFL